MLSLISLGGTISMLNLGEGAIPSLNADDLTSSFKDINAITFSNISSPNITFSMLIEVLNLAREEIKKGSRAVIITQGTDTLEESSFFCNLFWDLDEPLIFTGAMKNPSELGSDYLANISNAITLANSELARGLGVLCVLNDSVHSAQFIHKSNSFSLETFTSFNRGLVGEIKEGRFYLFNNNYKRLKLKPLKEITKKVALLKMCLDFDNDMLEYALNNYDGLVISGYGAGHVMARAMPIIQKANIPIIMTSRCESGKAGLRTYAYAGAEVDLIKNGVIMSEYLSDVKARALLISALSLGITNIKGMIEELI
ncbi:asparaginase [Campylobacter sp. RM12647]|uniref:asparaginase n=1 Tax=Campylobacter sp. RM12647 TaxID=2735737 RepID=UPI001D1BE3FF|nr:asparaginase [Campylobacter sp. RM12647]